MGVQRTCTTCSAATPALKPYFANNNARLYHLPSNNHTPMHAQVEMYTLHYVETLMGADGTWQVCGGAPLFVSAFSRNALHRPLVVHALNLR